MQFLESRNWPLGSAVSLVLTALMGILMLVYLRSIPKQERDL
jgi:ABC-type spermidine/putrescine transport system permease subunit I